MAILDERITPPGGHKIRNEEDNIFIATGTLDSLLRAWYAHRRAKGQPDMTRDEMVHEFCKQLPPDCGICGQPQVNPYLFADLAEWRKDENKSIDVWGSSGWKCCHSHRISDNQDENEQWMAAFVFSIPCNQYPRRCQQHFQEYLAAHPVDWSSQQAFLDWTIICHNDVNRRTGKSQMSIEEARALYL